MNWKKFTKTLIKKVVPMLFKVVSAALDLLGSFISKEYQIWGLAEVYQIWIEFREIVTEWEY